MNVVELPEGVRVLQGNKVVKPEECRVFALENGEPCVTVDTADWQHELLVEVARGAVCHARLTGDGNGHVRVTGAGRGDAVRDGSGNGDAVRDGDGDGDVWRDGGGDGDARRTGKGNGNAFREGNGRGNALNYSPWQGHARRLGNGEGDAVHLGSGTGNAWRGGSGKGDARRKGKGDGDAVRDGDGDGDAHRNGTGAGSAKRVGKGKGHAFEAPEMTIDAWNTFMAYWVFANYGRIREYRPERLHALAAELAGDALNWLRDGRPGYVGELLASSPDIARADPGYAAASIGEAAEQAIYDSLRGTALRELGAYVKRHDGEESSIDRCYEALDKQLAEHADEAGDDIDTTAERLVEKALQSLGLDQAAVCEIFRKDGSLWLERSHGDTLEDQMRCALRDRLTRFARRQLEIGSDEAAAMAPAP